MGNLKDQIAVVTGASSGIGKAIALALAAQGAELCLVARRQELLDDVAKQVHGIGSRGHACRADLTSDDDIRGLGERVERDFGHANILILCGGAISHGALEKASLADFDLMYRTNLRGHYALIQIMLPCSASRPDRSSSSTLPQDSVHRPPSVNFPPPSTLSVLSPIACARK